MDSIQIRPEGAPSRNPGRRQMPLPMKSAYSRTGLSVLAMYGVISVLAGLLIGIVLVGMMTMSILENSAEDAPGAFNLFSDLFELVEGGAAGWIVLLSAVASGAGMAVSLPLIRKMTRYGSHEPIPKKRLGVPAFLAVVMTAFGLWGVGVYLGNYTELLGYPVRSLLDYGGGSSLISALSLAYAVFGAPVVEELVFRKTLLDVLHPHGETCAALVTALLFGLIHGNSGQFFLAFLLGLLFAGVYMKTGHILYTIALHFIINLTASAPDLLRFAGIQSDWLFDMVVLPLLTIAGLIVFVVSYRKKAEWFRLSLPEVPDANRQVFANPGMLIAVIGGTVSAVGTDFYLTVYSAINADSLIPLAALLSTVMMIGTVVLVCTLGGRRWKRTSDADIPSWE